MKGQYVNRHKGYFYLPLELEESNQERYLAIRRLEETNPTFKFEETETEDIYQGTPLKIYNKIPITRTTNDKNYNNFLISKGLSVISSYVLLTTNIFTPYEYIHLVGNLIIKEEINQYNVDILGVYLKSLKGNIKNMKITIFVKASELKYINTLTSYKDYLIVIVTINTECNNFPDFNYICILGEEININYPKNSKIITQSKKLNYKQIKEKGCLSINLIPQEEDINEYNSLKVSNVIEIDKNLAYEPRNHKSNHLTIISEVFKKDSRTLERMLKESLLNNIPILDIIVTL